MARDGLPLSGARGAEAYVMADTQLCLHCQMSELAQDAIDKRGMPLDQALNSIAQLVGEIAASAATMEERERLYQQFVDNARRHYESAEQAFADRGLVVPRSTH
jgi:hypothetical protein